jgi:hypothetical protein
VLITGYVLLHQTPTGVATYSIAHHRCALDAALFDPYAEMATWINT